jgi:crotonobetainyl-CoA:carnitine CoA-transferase CaiB-like acyl-CoA transferase
MRALGGEHLIDDPRFADAASRSANIVEYRAEVKKLTDSITVAEFLANAVTHDVPASAINTLASVPDEPQVVHNNVFVERDHPVAGRIREARHAPRFGATPTSLPGHAPMCGEHTDEIAAELGFNPAALRADGAVF